MKNILYIAPSIKVKGGISAVIKGYLNTKLPEHHNIFLISSHMDGPKIMKLIIAILGLVKTFFYLLLNNIDIVHIHGSDIISSKRKYIYFKLVRLFNCKTIYHFHGASFSNQYLRAANKWKMRIKKIFEGSNLVICLSNSWKQTILEIAPHANIEVIPNSINLPDLSHPEVEKGHTVQLTFLGLIGERKGIFDLLIVLKRLVGHGYYVELKIGGNGDVHRLLKEIKSLGITNKVRYLGWISEKDRDRLLRKTDIFILPSYGEGMPMSILEAMSYGIPVISTYVGGISELVSNGQMGFLIEPGDLGALYERITELILSEEKRRKFGQRARSAIQNRHNIDINVHKIEKIYNSL